MTKHKFLFSNQSAQSAEARLNAQETQKLLDKWIPKHLKEPTPEPATTPASNCFRKVSAILARCGK